MSQFIYIEKVYNTNGCKLPEREISLLLINVGLISKIKIQKTRNDHDDPEWFNKIQLVVRLWSRPERDDYEVLYEEEAERFIEMMRKLHPVPLQFLIEKAKQLPEPLEIDLDRIPF